MGMNVINNNVGTAYQQTSQSNGVSATDSYQYASEAFSTVQQSLMSAQTAISSDDSGSESGTATEDQIRSAIKTANRRAHFGHTNAEFSYHEATKRISIKIIDKDTNEVIKEIPPEETLEMISKMWELAGLMVDEKR